MNNLIISIRFCNLPVTCTLLPAKISGETNQNQTPGNYFILKLSKIICLTIIFIANRGKRVFLSIIPLRLDFVVLQKQYHS
jgi:hypothetical protein